jgi:hypothetical protein
MKYQPKQGAEKAWAAEIKRRVDDIRSGKTKMIPYEEVRRRLAARLLEDSESEFYATPERSHEVAYRIAERATNVRRYSTASLIIGNSKCQ